MTKKFIIEMKYESFVLGKCQCNCGADIPIIKKKDKSRKSGHLKKYLNSAHSLKGKNQSGKNNPMWKGGEPKQDKDRYWLIYKPDHPNRNNENRVFGHRLIYEHYLSIILDEEVYLNKEEEIHHINKNKDDNSLINLQYMPTRKDHKQEHLIDMVNRVCRTCGTNETSLRSDSNKRPKWYGNLKDGWQCSSCNKKEYYIRNKKEISEIRKERWLNNKDEINKRKRELYKLKRNK